MIPPLIRLKGAPYAVLPVGIHWADLAEIKSRFATNAHRKWLFEGLELVVAALQAADCQTVYFDGSFVTAKPNPGDFDGCWDPVGVVRSKLDPVLLDFKNKRAAQKAKFRGEMFISTSNSGPGGTFLDFFQVEKSTRKAKGIVGVRLPKGGKS